MSFVVKHPDKPCWLWPGTVVNNGYGLKRFGEDDPSVVAHRWVYEQLVGPITPGYDLHHLCENRLCVNPIHLREVSRVEHAAIHARLITHCKNGHLYTPETVKVVSGKRKCLVCRREDTRRYKERHVEEINARRRASRRDAGERN